MKLFIPYIAPSTNAMYAGQHWSARSKHKSNAKKAVMVALAALQEKKIFTKPVHIQLEPQLGKGKRAYDVSNYSYTYKLIEDCLVERGVLVSDTAAFVKELRFKSPVRGAETGLMILISEV
jgi:hypothetical protein